MSMLGRMGPFLAGGGRPLSLDMRFDGADNGTVFTDETGKTVTRFGSTVTKTAIKVEGTASGLFVPATLDYLTVAASSDFDLSTGDFEIKFNFRKTANTTSYILSTNNSAFTSGWGVATSGGATHTIFLQGSSGTPGYLETGNVLTLNTWAAVRIERVGSTINIYVDDVLRASAASSTVGISNNPVDLMIGKCRYSSPLHLAGYLDALTISKG